MALLRSAHLDTMYQELPLPERFQAARNDGFDAVELTFSDASAIPAYAAFYIQTMAAQGVISGYADGTFKPGASITRGQMAKILYNLM